MLLLSSGAYIAWDHKDDDVFVNKVKLTIYKARVSTVVFRVSGKDVFRLKFQSTPAHAMCHGVWTEKRNWFQFMNILSFQNTRDTFQSPT